MTESHIENYSLALLQSLGWKYIEQNEAKILRGEDLRNVIFNDILKESLIAINPEINLAQIDEAILKLKNLEGGDLIDRNKLFCGYLRNGIKVEQKNGSEIITQTLKVFDFKDISKNSFIVTNQFTVLNDRENRRPDIVLLINGLPVVVIELKNAEDSEATIGNAYDQLQTYKATIDQIFNYNGLLVISDGSFAKMGSLTAGYDRFLAWKSIDGELAPKHISEIEVLIKGLLTPTVLLDVIQNFSVFQQTEKDVNGIKQISFNKIVAAYHQYFAVNKALESTKKARLSDKKAGVVWHTQGSGKSLSMVFYTGKVVQYLDNPTVVVITDRNDLDEQLFDTFAISSNILGQVPVNADSRASLKSLLTTSGGGIVFTTIQKFEEGEDCLSSRDNIVVIADEAHRSQYGFAARESKAGDVVYGYAKYLHDALPNASYIGFTGTPVEAQDRSTVGIFGDYIDIYDIKQAVDDKATVPIFYESRVIKFLISDDDKQKLDQAVDQVLDGVEDGLAEKLKRQGLNLETVVGNPDRIEKVAKDIVEHFEARSKVLKGKAMIVAISRTVGVRLLQEISKIRPSWYSKDRDKGKIKLIMSDLESSNSNYPQWQEYLTKKADRKELSKRLKNPNDELELVIVIDMWLTGFDAPSLHTLYIDKIMKTHNLMQAIARVNRVYGDKPGGLVVDYIGIAGQLKKALQQYTQSGGEGEIERDQESALGELRDRFAILKGMFEGIDYLRYFNSDVSQKLSLLQELADHVLGLQDGKKRFLDQVSAFTVALALTIPLPEAVDLSRHLLVFQGVKSYIQKLALSNLQKTESELSLAIKQLVDQSLETGEVVDLFDVAGVKKPEMGILSEEFLNDIKGLKHKNLASEALKKLLADEIKSRSKINITQSKLFSQRLESILNSYHNNLLNSTEIIEELIKLANEIKEKDKLNEEMGLSTEELAFYDALAQNDSANEVLGKERLGQLAKALVIKIQASSKIDWQKRSDKQAEIRLIVKRLLKEYGYPPDLEKLAIDTILEQTKVILDN
jgi:type I restriction enzyme R subunit